MDRGEEDIFEIARQIQSQVSALGLVKLENLQGKSVSDIYNRIVTDELLRDTTQKLFYDGHYALAVEEAFKCLNNFVKSRAGLGADGADLMRNVFTPKNPVLAINSLQTDSQRDQQQGYMDIFAGSMTGIRNPRAHEHRYLDEPQVALEMLALANHLMGITHSAKKKRRKSKKIP
jgi:uncharacterized protein (TIGR02391 family)